MIMLKKIKTFFVLDNKAKLMFTEAFLYLAWARFLKSLPFSKVAPKLGIFMNETSLNYKESNAEMLRNISEAITYHESSYLLGKSMSC